MWAPVLTGWRGYPRSITRADRIPKSCKDASRNVVHQNIFFSGGRRNSLIYRRRQAGSKSVTQRRCHVTIAIKRCAGWALRIGAIVIGAAH